MKAATDINVINQFGQVPKIGQPDTRKICRFSLCVFNFLLLPATIIIHGYVSEIMFDRAIDYYDLSDL